MVQAVAATETVVRSFLVPRLRSFDEVELTLSELRGEGSLLGAGSARAACSQRGRTSDELGR